MVISTLLIMATFRLPTAKRFQDRKSSLECFLPDADRLSMQADQHDLLKLSNGCRIVVNDGQISIISSLKQLDTVLMRSPSIDSDISRNHSGVKQMQSSRMWCRRRIHDDGSGVQGAAVSRKVQLNLMFLRPNQNTNKSETVDGKFWQRIVDKEVSLIQSHRSDPNPLPWWPIPPQIPHPSRPSSTSRPSSRTRPSFSNCRLSVVCSPDSCLSLSVSRLCRE